MFSAAASTRHRMARNEHVAGRELAVLEVQPGVIKPAKSRFSTGPAGLLVLFMVIP